jgi:hypothetical protein
LQEITMTKFTVLLGILAAVLAATGGRPEARAGDINGPAIAGLLLSNTSPELDFYALTLLAGSSMTDVLNTSSTDTTTGFTATLAGTYLGQALSATYTGNSTAFPGGAITWTSTGSYGVQAWTSRGNATFTFPSASTFQVAYSSSLAIGSNTVLTNLTISGADDGTSLFYTDSTGTMTVNTVPIPPPGPSVHVPVAPKAGTPDEHDETVNGQMVVWGTTEIQQASPSPPAPPDLIVDIGNLQEGGCPEPSSLVLAGFGVLGLLVGCACCHRGKSGEKTQRPPRHRWVSSALSDKPISGA